MPVINTTEDLLRLLDENEQFLAAARHKILTDELIRLPQRFDEYTAATDKKFEALLEQAAALTKHAEATNKRLDAIESDVRDIKRDINGLGDSFRREVRAQSSYRGNYAQVAAKGRDIQIAALFAHRHGLNPDLIETWELSRTTLRECVRKYAEMGISLDLHEGALQKFRRPDSVAAVTDIDGNRDDAPAYYICTEASYTVEEKDIDRAADNAKILRAVTGIPAYPVVAGAELDDRMTEAARRRLYDDVSRIAESDDPDAAYFCWLDSADMRPPEPR